MYPVYPCSSVSTPRTSVKQAVLILPEECFEVIPTAPGGQFSAPRTGRDKKGHVQVAFNTASASPSRCSVSVAAEDKHVLTARLHTLPLRNKWLEIASSIED